MDKVKAINANTLLKALYSNVLNDLPKQKVRRIEEVIREEPVLKKETTHWKVYPATAECAYCKHWVGLADYTFYKFCPYCGREIEKGD